MTEIQRLRKDVAATTRATLLPAKNGMLLQEFLRDYREHTGQHIPNSRLGYGSVQELLESMPDVVRMYPQDNGDVLLEAVPEKNTKHLAEMVAKQKTASSKGASNKNLQKQKALQATKDLKMRSAKTRMLPRFIQSNIETLLKQQMTLDEFMKTYEFSFSQKIDYEHFGFYDAVDMLKSIPGIVDLRQDRDTYILRPVVHEQAVVGVKAKLVPPGTSTSSSSLSSDANIIWPQRNPRRPPPPVKLPKNIPESQDIRPPAKSTPSSGDWGSSSLVPNIVKENLNTLLLGYKVEGLPIDRLPRLYKAMFGSELDCRDYGCTTMVEFVLLLPDVCRATRRERMGNWIIFGVYDDQGPTGLAEKPPYVPKEIEENVRGVLKANPSGVSLGYFGSAYASACGSRLNVEGLGFLSVDEFVNVLTDDMVDLVGKNEKIMILPKHELLREFIREEEMAQSTDYSDVICTGPIDQVEFKPKKDEIVEVIIAEIFNPGAFWFQLRGPKYSDMLSELMTDLETFYSSKEGKALQIPEPKLTGGLYCVCKYEDGNWHRAFTKTAKDLNSIDVFYIDYGTTSRVLRTEVYYLHKRFAELPAQALTGRLASVLPVKPPKWSRESSLKFLTLTAEVCKNDKGLVAMVKGLRECADMNDRFSLMLFDTVTNDLENGININELMVTLGHAVWDPNAADTDSHVIPKVLNRPAQRDRKRLRPLRRPVFQSGVHPAYLANPAQGHPNPMYAHHPMSPLSPWASSGYGSAPYMHSQALPPYYHGVPHETPFPTMQPMMAELPVNAPLNPGPPLNPEPPMLFATPPASTTSRVLRPKPMFGSSPVQSAALNVSSLVSNRSRGEERSTKEETVAREERGSTPVGAAKETEDDFDVEAVTIDDSITIHRFTIDKIKYLLSTEISSLFPRWKGKDLLEKMLRLKGLSNTFKTKEITMDQHPLLFEQMIVEDVPGVSDRVTLYRMKDIPEILEVLLHSSELARKKDLRTQIMGYDPYPNVG